MKINKEFFKNTGITLGVFASLATVLAGVNYITEPSNVEVVKEDVKPTPTVSPSVQATATPTPITTVDVKPSVSPVPVVTPTVYVPQLLKGDKGPALTLKEVEYLKAIHANSSISKEDKVKLEKAPRTLIKVGNQSCKYSQQLFVAGASTAINATGNQFFIRDFSNKPEVYTAVYVAAKTTLCK